MQSISNLFLAACLALAACFFVSPSSASAVIYANLPSAGGVAVIGTSSANGRVYFVFRTSAGQCSLKQLTSGPFGLTDYLVVNGTSGADVIIISDAPTSLCNATWGALDVNTHGGVDVFAGAGNDWISGRFRDAYGGDGNDFISGASSSFMNDFQTLLGEGGADRLYGSEDSQLNGGTGSDVLCAHPGQRPYLFRGGSGFDQGCGPYDAVWNNDVESLDQNCPAICNFL
jgi:hypothetical protein